MTAPSLAAGLRRLVVEHQASPGTPLLVVRRGPAGGTESGTAGYHDDYATHCGILQEPLTNQHAAVTLGATTGDGEGTPMALTVTTLWSAACGDDDWCPGEYRIKERPGTRYLVATPTSDLDVLAVIPNVGPREVIVELPEM